MEGKSRKIWAPPRLSGQKILLTEGRVSRYKSKSMRFQPGFQSQRFWVKATFQAGLLLIIFLIGERLSTVQRGLQGIYYPGVGWSGTPAFSTIDPVISLDTAYSRRATFPTKDYSIRWTGWIRIDRPGLYTFTTRSDDGSTLRIDGKKVVDNGGSHSLQEASGALPLETGFHRIELKYFQRKGRDAMSAYWQPPGRRQTLIPSEVLFPVEPKPGRILLEKVFQRGSLVFQVITSLLLALTVILNRKQLYRGVQQLPSVLRFSRSPLLPLSFFCFLLSAFCLLYWIRSGHGLTGKYYDNQNWGGDPVFSMPDASLDPKSLYKAIPHRPQEPNSLEWVGWIFIRHPAAYSFTIRSDGAMLLSFDDFPVLEKENNEAIQTVSTVFYLAEGLHPMRLAYLPATGTSHILEASWSRQGTREAAIPGDILFQERPDQRSLLFRDLSSWAYRSVQILGLLSLGLLGVFVLSHQRALADGFLQWKDRKIREWGKGRILRLYPLQGRIDSLCRQTWVHLLIILGLTLLLVFNNLGRGSLITTDLDEGSYTRVAQLIAKTGVWWSLYQEEGVTYYDKPPLKFWLSALTFSLLGDSEFFIRFWDAVFGLFTFILLYFLGTRLFSSRAVGLLSVLILLGCRDFISNHGVRAGVMDSLMIFFFVLSLFLFQFREKGPRYYYLAGLCMGLGALTKSVQALIPLGIIVLYLILTRQYGEFKSLPFFGMVFLALLIPALWYVPQAFLRPRFVRLAIIRDIILRAQGKIHVRHIHGPLFYFPTVYDGFFPWSLVALPAIGIGLWQAIFRPSSARLRASSDGLQTHDPVWRYKKEMGFLLIWIFIIFIGFSLSKMKVVWYMHPLYPALSMLIAAVFIP